MTNISNLVSAPWIIPVDSKQKVLTEHSFAIANGKIIDILPTKEATAKYQNVETINYPNHVLLPGFVNAHAHTPMVLLRGIGDALPLKNWLEDYIWPAEKNLMSEEFIRDGMQLGIAEMLLNGTTCFSEHYFLPEISATVTQETGMRAVIGIEAFNDNYALGKSLIDSSSPMLSFAYAPHSPYMVDDAGFKKILSCCKSHPAPIHIHLHESMSEITNSLKQYNKTPIARLHELGIFDEHVIAVHMVHCNTDDLNLLRGRPCHIVTCPDSNLKLASGICNINDFHAASLNVAVGTDGAASNNDLDMLAEARNASLLNKALNSDPCLTSANTTLEMLTINGAKALGLEQHIGSLEVGKSADFVAWDVAQLNSFPRHDLVAQIVFAAASSQVTDVWVNGVRLLKDRQFTKLSMPELLDKAKFWESKTKHFC